MKHDELGDVVNDDCPTDDDIDFRKRALGEAILCIGCLKVVSVICYTGLAFMVIINTEGWMSTAFQSMILAAVTLNVICGALLFLGVLKCNSSALCAAIWLGLLSATYNTVMGAVGAVYYIRNGTTIAHYVLAGIFSMNLCSICVTVCHDVVIIHSYMKSIQGPYVEERTVNTYVVQTTANIFSNLFGLSGTSLLRSNNVPMAKVPPIANSNVVQDILKTELEFSAALCSNEPNSPVENDIV